MKNVVLICLFGLCANLSYGQYSLSFCEDVNNSGKPVSPSNSFLVNKTGSALKVLLKSDSQLIMAKKRKLPGFQRRCSQTGTMFGKSWYFSILVITA
jgi:hypothetical protein